MHARLRVITCLVSAAALVAACGSDDGDDTATDAASDTATDAADAQPDASTAAGGDSGDATAGGTCAGDDWDAVVAAAEDEGVVRLYTSHLPNQQKSLEAAFEAAYPGIDLESTRVLGELEATLDAERTTDTAGADVAVNNAPEVPEKYLADGGLVTIAGPQADNWADNETFVDDQFFVTNYNSLGIAWNTDEVPDGVSSFEDLLAPEFEGRVGITDGSSSSAIIDWWAYLEENFGGEEFLREFAAQQPVVFETAVPMQQAVIVGEIAVATYAGPWILDERDAGAPIDFAFPDPAWSAPFYAFGLAWGANPNATCVLLDFMMSPEGQAALAINGASALDGVDGLIPLDQTAPSQVADREPGFIEEFGARWREIFGR
jgi:iron(III) transport system substrate-binding protein